MQKYLRSIILPAFLFLTLQAVAQNGSDSVVIPADTFYKASFIRKFFLGDKYRDVWTAPVKAPVVKLDTLKGGLKAVELGGGQQTKNLRLMDKDSNLYALRSIQKFPDKALPEQLRFFPITFLAKDQISSSMPYGAFILPAMEEHVGMFHTNPQLYYVTKDPVLGEHQEIFEGTLVLFESRPEDFNEPDPSFGLTNNWIETDNMQEDREESLRHIYNDRLFLKSRFFDMIVGDWDRHEGQWNWGVYKKDDYTYYQPVPVDRDNVFYNFDGFLPWFFSRDWAIPKFQLYQPHFRNISGFNYNARFVDRYFLNELELEDWIQIADSLKTELDNNIIESSVKQLPDTIYTLVGPFLEKRIKSRRDEITKAAETYYHHLAEKVNVVGSDNPDLFEVNILNDEQVQVLLFEYINDVRSADTFYNRTFEKEETKEVRLYGREGKDKFIIKGNQGSSIKIRIIGGEDDDVVETEGSSELGNKIFAYDYPNSIKSEDNSIRKYISNDTSLNEYDFKQYKRDYLGPTGSFGYNRDDGFYLEGGILKKVRGFDVEFVSEQSLTATFQFGVNAGRVDYTGIFRKVIDERAGFTVNAHYLAPEYPVNFFGFGNETSFDKDIIYYRYDLEQVFIQPMLNVPVWNFTFSLGPHFQYTYLPQLPYENITKKYAYTGVAAALNYSTLDNLVMPEKGFDITAEATFATDIINEQDQWEFKGNATTFFDIEKFIFGLRVGAATTSSITPFFRAPSLGSHENLRGYRQNRFHGKSIIYQNTDLRYKLTDVAGFILFNDFGKAFTPLIASDKWHHSYGLGVFIAPEEVFALTATVAKGREETLFDISFGFFF